MKRIAVLACLGFVSITPAFAGDMEMKGTDHGQVEALKTPEGSDSISSTA